MKVPQSEGVTRKFGVAASLLAVFAIAACDEQIVLTDAAVSRDDPCSPNRATISQARQTDIDAQAQNAAAGALIGALIGAAVSSEQDRTQGILTGAVAGGLAGYSATYYNQVARRSADARALLSNVNSDAGQEARLVTETGRAVRALRSCRDGQLVQLTNSVRSGAVTTTQGRAQLRVIQSAIRADNRVISAAFNGIGRRVDGYVDATTAVAQVDSAISASQARARAPSVQRVARQTNNTVAQDTRDQEQLAARMDALDALLG